MLGSPVMGVSIAWLNFRIQKLFGDPAGLMASFKFIE
jgi:hypothetical protein